MKVLFITAGLTPARGRSNSYQESLMEAMSTRGHEVSCICTANTALKPGIRWKRSQEQFFRRYSIANGGVYPAQYSQGGVGSLHPLKDVQSRSSLRRAILDVIAEVKPEVISIQSLFGLPLDLIVETRKKGIPVVFTAHDYFALCPTAHLFLPTATRCRLVENELLCRRCCANSPSYFVFWITNLLNRWAERAALSPRFRTNIWRCRNVIKRLGRMVSKPAALKEYILRQRMAIEFLKQLDILHCISHTQAEVFREIGGRFENIHVLPLIPPTINKPNRTRCQRASSDFVRFVALNVHSPYKGSKLLEQVFQELAVSTNGYELHIYGNVAPGPSIPSVFYHGRYASGDLDHIAASADFCIIPSLWDETLGFVGLEMMVRQVPLIVSSRAGVSEFVRPEVDGFIFEPDTDGVLLHILKRLVAKPELRESIRSNLLSTDCLRMDFDGHVADVEALFNQALQQFNVGIDRWQTSES